MGQTLRRKEDENKTMNCRQEVRPREETHPSRKSSRLPTTPQPSSARDFGPPPTKEALIASYEGLVIAQARRYGKGAMEWEDLIQEGYLALFELQESYDPTKGPFPAYVRDHLKYFFLGLRRTSMKAPEELPFDEAKPQEDLAPSAEEMALLNEERAHLHDLLCALPEAQAQTLRLYAEGFSRREIAEITKTPYPTVTSRLRTGLNTHKKRL